MILIKTARLAVLVTVLVVGAADPSSQSRPPLSSADIDDIAMLLKLEDTRTFDESALERIVQSAHPEVRRRAIVSIGRIVNERGRALLQKVRSDADVEIRATVVFATGQLKDPGAVTWLGGLLDLADTPAVVAKEAAQALGKIRTPEARAALSRYLMHASTTEAAEPVVGEALLAIGRFADKGDVAPIVRWINSPKVEIRWCASWALFRPRDPAAVRHSLKLADDPSAEVRFWAVRGLLPALVDQAGLERAPVSARLRAAVKDDKDRRVRTEALRVLVQYDDDGAFAELLAALTSRDTWISTSAAEVVGRFSSRSQVLTPKLIAAAAPNKPLWLRQTLLTPLTTLAPAAAVDVAASMARAGSAAGRTSAVQALGRLGEPGRAKLDELNADPALKGLLPTLGAGRGGGGRGTQPAAPARTDVDYRRLVEKWIVPDYDGKPRPRAVWTFSRGTVELELFAGDAPMGAEYFMKAIESGDLVGTEFGRVVPNFVAQQQGIRNAPTLRDEVNRHGLLRATLAWASSGLDTGRPGYTLANTPQPHNEGDFTALGSVVKGMDVVDKLEWGDKIISAKIK